MILYFATNSQILFTNRVKNYYKKIREFVAYKIKVLFLPKFKKLN